MPKSESSDEYEHCQIKSCESFGGVHKKRDPNIAPQILQSPVLCSNLQGSTLSSTT